MLIVVVKLTIILKVKPVVFRSTALGKEDKDAKFVETDVLLISTWL